MNIKANLILECINQAGISICSYNDDIPFCDIDGDPKSCVANLLERMTSVKINPYVSDWLTLELADTYYDIDANSVYLIYVCRVGENLPLQAGYKWSDIMTMKPKLDKIKGLI